jgi:hypothetical protein
MLPTYPAIEEISRQEYRRTIQKMTAEFEPILSSIDSHIQFEGRGNAIIRHDDTVGKTPMHAIAAEVQLQKLKLTEFTEEEFFSFLADIAKQFAKGFGAKIYSEINAAADSVGNVVSAEGKPFSEDLLLKTLEKMEHNFSPDGRWQPPRIMAGSAVVEKIQEMMEANPNGSPDFNTKLGLLLARKKDEYRSREASRILAG